MIILADVSALLIIQPGTTQYSLLIFRPMHDIEIRPKDQVF